MLFTTTGCYSPLPGAIHHYRAQFTTRCHSSLRATNHQKGFVNKRRVRWAAHESMARTARMARRETRDSSAMWEKNKYVVCCLQASRLRGAQPALHRVCKVFDVLMRDADASTGHSLEPLSRKSLSRKSQGTLVTNAPDALCFLLAACCLLDGHMIVDTRSRAGRPEYRIPLGEPLLLEREPPRSEHAL